MPSENKATADPSSSQASEAPHILLVEDDSISALALRRMIESDMDAEIDVVATAEDAIRYFDRTGYDVVLMDIFLKGDLDGIEAVTQIHKASDVPVIYITASSDPTTQQRAEQTRPFAFLRKPYEQTAVLDTIHDSLRTAQSRKKQAMIEPDYLLDLVYDTADIGMCVTDSDGLFVKTNRAYRQTYGYSADELIGTHFTHVLPEEIRERASEIHTNFVYGRSSEAAGEWKVITKQGETRNVYVTAGRLVTSDGNRFKVTTVTDITEQKQQIAALEHALEERDTLIREVYHRVKNNLNLVNSMLYLQARQFGESAELSRALNDSINRIKTLAAVHDRLYRAEDLISIEMKPYVDELTRSLIETLQSSEDVALEISVDDIRLDLDRTIACGLILNELISNALYHGVATTDDPAVSVIVVRDDGNIALSVKDNGTGLPDDFDVNNTETLGMQLIHTITRQLDAEVTASNEAGAVVSIVFPETQAGTRAGPHG